MTVLNRFTVGFVHDTVLPVAWPLESGIGLIKFSAAFGRPDDIGTPADDAVAMRVADGVAVVLPHVDEVAMAFFWFGFHVSFWLPECVQWRG